MSGSLNKALNIPQICDGMCLKKFERLLKQRFAVTIDPNPSNAIMLKMRLNRSDLSKAVHIDVFSTGIVLIKSSPANQLVFNNVFTEIENISNEATHIISRDTTPVRVNRAQKILNYVHNLSIIDEVDRMVIVTFCDVVLDLIVSEKLSTVGGSRAEQEGDNVGAKIDLLENKYHAILYNPKPIRDIRNLRNNIVHGADPIIEQEATYAIESTEEIFAYF